MTFMALHPLVHMRYLPQDSMLYHGDGCPEVGAESGGRGTASYQRSHGSIKQGETFLDAHCS